MILSYALTVTVRGMTKPFGAPLGIPLYRGCLLDIQRKTMSRYHTKLKNQIRQIQLDTIAIRRIRKEMEKELEGELTLG